MPRRYPVLALAAVVSLAACSTDLVAPTKTVRGPSFALSTAGQSGTYLVLMKGNGIPAGFATRVANLGGTVTYSHAATGIATVTGLGVGAASQLAASSGVADVQADESFTLDTPLAAAETDAAAVDNPSINSQANPAGAARYNFQWNMRLIGANNAWAAGKLGDAGVTVAILDTGIDYDAPDLNGLVDLSRSTSFMSTYYHATGTPERPADDVVSGTNFPSRNRISDYNGHGTNVASQVSSKAVALAGVTSHTTLIGVKVLGSNGSGSTATVIPGILWAADHGADVANMSLGGGFSKAASGRFVAFLNRTFNYTKQKGMLIVVAAGNAAADLQHEGNFFSTYCDAVHVVCVSSVGPGVGNGDQSQPAYYSNFGRGVVDVAAPGGNAAFDSNGNIIVSTWPWGNDIASWVWAYCSKTRIAGWTGTTPTLTACVAGNRITGYIGTSQATPHVAGLAALLVAQYGHGQPQLIKHYIEQSSVSTDPLFDPRFGRGVINVTNALGL